MRNESYQDYTATPHPCHWEGCCEAGQYPAPKSPQNLQERQMFCLEHVRAYNKQWNYFSTMQAEQIEAFHRDSLSGHRPTWKMGVNSKYYTNTEQLREQVFGAFHTKKERKERSKAEPAIPQTEKDALKMLGLTAPATWNDIKKKYKALAKALHPDINDNGDEERLKLINQAYSHLKSIYNS